MCGFLDACLNEISIVEKFKTRKQRAQRSYVSRDALDKKPSTKALSGSSATSEVIPLLWKENEKNWERKNNGAVEKKVGIKVKILMTKEEAARLLSNCREGGVLEFKHVARELVEIPMNRIHVVSPASSSEPALESIPEEL